jgi:IS5 family transposase
MSPTFQLEGQEFMALNGGPQFTWSGRGARVCGMKLKFGFVKLRYRGLKKNSAQLFAVCALVNLLLVRKKLLLLVPA